mgnify:CR=1 FL=1
MDGPVPVVLEPEGQSAHPEKEVFDMKKALAGLLIFGMVGAAMVVPAAAAGHHGGGHGGCHRTWTATQTAVCPWSGEDCPWGGDCDGWCVNGGVCDGTGWARHHG